MTLRQKVRHDVKIMTLRQKVHHQVKKYIITSKSIVGQYKLFN